MNINYKNLGLVCTKEMFKKAIKEKFAIPAYNFSNMEQLQAIIQGCIETDSPVILQISSSAYKYVNPILLRHMITGITQMTNKKIPIALHLDHGNSFELCKSCIDNGFSSVMIDGSAYSYKENIYLTKKVVKYAHLKNVVVEAELGVLAGIEDTTKAEKNLYTQPEKVEDFISKTGVDSLAISIGTSHGAYKFKIKPNKKIPSLRFNILKEIKKQLPNFPIVLHGASSILPKYVNIINQNGGNIESATGVSESQLRKAIQNGICKINIDSDLRLVMTAIIRKTLTENPKEFDPRKYLGLAREELIKIIKYKNKKVLSSAGFGHTIF
ncbi:fructose-1,6-bisphosphate aldolase, class II [Candidatus Kuenenbacteria bacterium HGW-Kuenenbacteria-1]|uniref:Fructose-1,6-bisphosphate aldolase, class II n=1 Tax=Candidatus Kuenenbacteria bacterium HGW-Kuenenbacteria-1 TaxID=2013812 RepID=A0A2N1UN15_9BACT|nr:MAG: fructose-1,6-bisphosphate aldolase, class II [Candidatus Kuenenbacteria bacterium HGW-Kuenenbacteria-1]